VAGINFQLFNLLFFLFLFSASKIMRKKKEIGEKRNTVIIGVVYVSCLGLQRLMVMGGIQHMRIGFHLNHHMPLLPFIPNPPVNIKRCDFQGHHDSHTYRTLRYPLNALCGSTCHLFIYLFLDMSEGVAHAIYVVKPDQ
jgi:hypothetical protein